PRLSASSIDQGFHAIPAVASTDPSKVSCYFSSDDYTCVKDSTREYWDPNGKPPISGTIPAGCWRMEEAGHRFLPGQWPARNSTADRRPSDFCNGYENVAIQFS